MSGKSFFENRLLVGVISVVIGILLILCRVAALSVVIRIIGIVMLAVAIYKIVGYAARKSFEAKDMAATVAAIVAGIIFAVAPSGIIIIFPILLGIAMAVLGVVMIISISRVTNAASGEWVFKLIVGIGLIVLGIIAIIFPVAMAAAIVVICGIVLLIYGVGEIYRHTGFGS